LLGKSSVRGRRLPGYESSRSTEVCTYVTIKGFDQIKDPMDGLYTEVEKNNFSEHNCFCFLLQSGRVVAHNGNKRNSLRITIYPDVGYLRKA
jgi:hypothetical protein